ncbi:hypothetical protein F4560_006541 [Saccharothrix ecbatanensis]|uniref:Uncharacterized protein n=1 Tax=Saccharothrix ecbatanensis TaxID=1105145 RepID=A0A7W9M493_9PSEU|nr:hypothetical protein [Saccharothrix ecbatanensis]
MRREHPGRRPTRVTHQPFPGKQQPTRPTRATGVPRRRSY